jgi:hypothetical protein
MWMPELNKFNSQICILFMIAFLQLAVSLGDMWNFITSQLSDPKDSPLLTVQNM